MITSMFKSVVCFLTLFFVDGFVPSSSSTTTTNLWMSSTTPSRRDVIKNAGFGAAVAATTVWINPDVAQAFGEREVTPQSAANKANESYQGVYYDPKHPTGYRTIMAGANGKTTMTLSDGVPKGSTEEPKTFRNIPVSVNNDGYELVFDFGFKGGPKQIKGKLSPDKQSIMFEDGNTWTKNYYKYDGIYKVTTGDKSKDAYRVITKVGADIMIEINDTGNPKDSKFIDGAAGSLFSIPTSEIKLYYGGKGAPEEGTITFQEAWNGVTDAPTTPGTVTGKLSLNDWNPVFPYGTITFPDKSMWTRI